MTESTPPNVLKATALLVLATSHDDLSRRLKVVTTAARPKVPYGIQRVSGVSLEKTRIAANEKAVALLDTLSIGDTLTDEQRRILAGYTGEGGIKGNQGTDGSGKMHEYYTPEHVALGMWDMLAAYGADVGNGLEPSAGTGIFNETKPASAIMTAAELSPISAKINQLLHPEDKVNAGAFELVAAKTPDDSFDFSIGNVPFGNGRPTARLDPEYMDEQHLGRYFVHRMIDKTKPNGLICVVVPHGMTSGADNKKFRAAISRKAEFLGAHRMPSSTFENSGTETATDVWVLKKHPEEAVDRIANASSTELSEAYILWDTFINGQWFEKDGKHFILGTDKIVGVGKFARRVVERDGKSNDQIRQALAHKFHSRILWDLLEFVPNTAPHMYVDGERRVINGRWHSYTMGHWEPEHVDVSQPLDADHYGASSVEGLQATLASHPGTLSLSLAQIQSIATDFPHIVNERVLDALSFASQQKASDRERVFRGYVIGQAIADLKDTISLCGSDSQIVQGDRKDIAKLVEEEAGRYGAVAADRQLSKLSGKGSGYWLTFVNATSADGTLSDLLSDGIDVKQVQDIDMTDPVAVVRHVFGNRLGGEVSLDEFRAAYNGQDMADEPLLQKIASQHPEIAITPTGGLLPFERAISGNASALKASLHQALGYPQPPAVQANFQRQLAEISTRQKKTPPENITFNMKSRWFDRALIAEFLQSEGYDKLRYVKTEHEIQDGILVAEDYHGKDGVFTGYVRDSIENRTTKELTFKEANRADEKFERQLEKYLNGQKPRSNTAAGTTAYIERINELEQRFDTFIRQHDDFEKIVAQYNDTFNDYIPFEHSSEPLGLTGISGARVPFSYQNSAVRRLSEDGKGILGFGTGMGKTTTALALEAYNYEQGRSKRTGIVVPKAVLENWYHEAREFYSAEAFSHMLFVGLDVVKDKDGNIQKVPVLDENGQPVINAQTNQPSMRDAVTISSGEVIKSRMHSIPHSNWRIVVMTKEQYAAIPLRDDTIDDVARDTVNHFANGGKVDLAAENHTQAQKLARVKAKAADTGSTKDTDYPFFEDMEFDSVIVDEGHNYRNSYGLGRESAGLAYLPAPSVADCARDMAFKNSYLMKKFNGRGPVLLTATPTVNSPVDAFNMLSHVMTQSEWEQLGIYSPDDFIRVFGQTETVTRMKISGEAVAEQGLVGFQNLDGLRNLFHRQVNMKKPEDVGKEAVIPDLEESNVQAPLSPEQSDLYEQLRWRAKWATMTKTERMFAEAQGAKAPVDKDGNEIEKDEVFSIIRDMDRVCSDLDLYYRHMTFRFSLDDADSVKALAESLPKATKEEVEDGDGNTETISVAVEYQLNRSRDCIELVVPESFEKEVIKRLGKFKISSATHPITPKFAAMLANVKTHYDAGGKQIIFTDEKSLHGKVCRLIAHHLGIKENAIGIINATSVAARGKGSPTPKMPKKPSENATEEVWNEYLAAMDAYNIAKGTIELTGLEGIAADYNEGRTRIVICNKKAEVGINLHKGTTAIHHLTLPWTPASIAQRNGRGARVGASQSKVAVYYYCGKGSFDEYRLETLKRKAAWINDLFTSEEARMRNADIDDTSEATMLLATSEEERKEQEDKAKKALEEKMRAEAMKIATDNLAVYLKAVQASTEDGDSLQRQRSEIVKSIEKVTQKIEDVRANIDSVEEWRVKFIRKEITASTSRKRLLEKSLRQLDKKIQRAAESEKVIKRLAPTIKSAIDKKLLDIDPELLTHPESFVMLDNSPVKIGSYFDELHWLDDQGDLKDSRGVIMQLTGFDPDSALVSVKTVNGNSNYRSRISANLSLQYSVNQFRKNFKLTSYTPDEIELAKRLSDVLSPERAITLFGVDKAIEYAAAGRLKVEPGRYILYQDDGTLGVESCSVFTNEDVCELLRRYCHVEPSDMAMLRQVAKFLSKRVAEKASLPSSIQVEAMFGKRWQSVIVEYLDNAAPEAISEFVGTQVAAVNKIIVDKRVVEGLAGGLYYSDYTPNSLLDSLLSEVNPPYPTGVKNKDEIVTAVTSAVTHIIERAKADADKQRKATALAAFERFQHAAGNPDEQIAERAASLKQAYTLWVRKNGVAAPYQGGEIHRITISFNGSNSSLNLSTSSLPDFALALADCVSLGYADEQDITLDDMASIDHQAARLKSAIDKMEQLKQEEADKNAADTAAAALTEKPEPIQQSEPDGVLEMAAELGLKVRKNTAVIYSGRRRFEAGTAWGLSDPKGKNGVLYAQRTRLKELFKATFYDGTRKQADNELYGDCWWMIPSQYDINKVINTLKNND